MVKAELLEPYIPGDAILRLPLTTPSMRDRQRYADGHEVGRTSALVGGGE